MATVQRTRGSPNWPTSGHSRWHTCAPRRRIAHRSDHRVNRRTFLHASGIAAAGYGLSACAPKTAPSAAASSRAAVRPPAHLVPVKASWERVIRTTVGLRPHRDPGFVLKADKLDAKLLVHNYGHGGAGVSPAGGAGGVGAPVATEHPAPGAGGGGCGAGGAPPPRPG